MISEILFNPGHSMIHSTILAFWVLVKLPVTTYIKQYYCAFSSFYEN